VRYATRADAEAVIIGFDMSPSVREYLAIQV
jgi:hypothetical protein